MPQAPRGSGDPSDRGPVGVAVDVEHRDGAVVLHVAGELDMLTTPQLEERMAVVLESRPKVLVVDLGEVTFLASSAMAALVAAQTLGGERTAVRVVAGSRQTIRALEITGLTDALALYPTVHAATTG